MISLQHTRFVVCGGSYSNCWTTLPIKSQLPSRKTSNTLKTPSEDRKIHLQTHSDNLPPLQTSPKKSKLENLRAFRPLYFKAVCLIFFGQAILPFEGKHGLIASGSEFLDYWIGLQENPLLLDEHLQPGNFFVSVWSSKKESVSGNNQGTRTGVPRSQCTHGTQKGRKYRDSWG